MPPKHHPGVRPSRARPKHVSNAAQCNAFEWRAHHQIVEGGQIIYHLRKIHHHHSSPPGVSSQLKSRAVGASHLELIELEGDTLHQQSLSANHQVLNIFAKVGANLPGTPLNRTCHGTSCCLLSSYDVSCCGFPSIARQALHKFSVNSITCGKTLHLMCMHPSPNS